MAIRYFIKYYDVVDIEHRFNIYDDNYVGDALQVDGTVNLTYAETDDVLEAIKGQGLSVELEANESLTFNNLWSEEEKTFRVEYKRDDVLLFEGWLNPEGFFENWVNTKWVVTFDCVDGLGYLKDLSFVEDATGLPITGRKKYIDLLSLALIRTGLYLKINTSVGIVYGGLSESLDVLDNVYANTERYIKDDGETIMSCEEVLRDILEPFGACLTYFKGEWYIYKPNELYNNANVTFFKYTYLGVIDPLTPSETIDLTNIIGSNWKGATLHHCSGNQQIKNKASIGAYRINYKYGLVQSLVDNTILYSSDGLTIASWDIISMTNVIPLVAGESGFTFDNVLINSGLSVENLRSEVSIIDDSSIGVNAVIDYYNGPFVVGSPGAIKFRYQLIVCDELITTPGVNIYYLQNDLTWSVSINVIEFTSKQESSTIDITTPPKPTAITGSGYFYISIWTPEEGPIVTHNTKITNISLLPGTQGSNSLVVKGEFHTVQRTTKPSSKIKDIKEVATGDNSTDLYEGTLYKSDIVTPTEVWNRKGITEAKPILQIMGEETLRMSPSPIRVFSGDVFGFYNYLNVITIDGLNGKFMPIKYNYNTKSNIINAELTQIYGDELTDINYELTYDYGNTVKPTIK